MVPVVLGIGCWTRRSEIGIGHKTLARGDAGGSWLVCFGWETARGEGRTEMGGMGRCEVSFCDAYPVLVTLVGYLFFLF